MYFVSFDLLVSSGSLFSVCLLYAHLEVTSFLIKPTKRHKLAGGSRNLKNMSTTFCLASYSSPRPGHYNITTLIFRTLDYSILDLGFDSYINLLCILEKINVNEKYYKTMSVCIQVARYELSTVRH